MLERSRGIPVVPKSTRLFCEIHSTRRVMMRLSIIALVCLLLTAGLHAIPLFAATAQSLIPTGLHRDGVSELGLRLLHEPGATRASKHL